MKEILRVENLKFDDWLNGYDLSIYKGEIIYIQALVDKSLDSLMDILSGKLKPDSGRIFVHESETSMMDYNSSFALEQGIYAVSFADAYAENATIAESIEPMKPPYYLFSKRKTEEKIGQYFSREQVSFKPDMPIWKLNDTQRKKLGILKAKLMHAKLVMLNLNKEVIEGKMARELWDMIQKLNEEGMTFLILSCYYTPLSEFATRTQFLYLGRALKEWTKVPDSVREKLKYGDFFKFQDQQTVIERNFIGLYDYEWDLQYDFWEYLNCVKVYNRQIWGQYLSASIPESGIGYLNKTVIIPRNSQDMLFENLSIGENLMIAASKKVTYDYTPVINDRMWKNVEGKFYKEQNLRKTDVDVRKLSSLQKKILSIARLEILKPSVILLELPYQGVSMDEISAFRAYLFQLTRKGIKIAYFSKSLESMQEDCKVIIRTQNGQSAKIDTFSQHFPPR